jgi:hypothetical protein
VAGSCEYGDKPAGSGARELENFHLTLAIIFSLYTGSDRDLLNSKFLPDY